MNTSDTTQLLLLSDAEASLRFEHIKCAMQACNAQAVLLHDNANLFYLTGRVWDGYILIPSPTAPPLYFTRRPTHLTGPDVKYIRKPEDIPSVSGMAVCDNISLELDTLSYNETSRLHAIWPNAKLGNASQIMRRARSVKTDTEISILRQSAQKQTLIYSRIPSLYSTGMTDIELQIEIERISRLEGCLGQFRISGSSMELFMGSVLAGGNADNPSPYDFAMGGAGLHPSLPVGANGTLIKPKTTLMVDVNGNYTGYMTDMTRTYALEPENLDQLAVTAHQCSIDICKSLAHMGKPGTPAKQLYETALNMATEASLHQYFMGHKQKAGFVGHGVGIEINEAPVIAPRSRDTLALGNVIALEPKFVIPHIGAVGIEDTYVVTAQGMESITKAPHHITAL